jgi:hypothetical protein
MIIVIDKDEKRALVLGKVRNSQTYRFRLAVA